MKKYVVKKYEGNKKIEYKIKDLIVNILSVEQGHEEWRNTYLTEDYDRDNLVVLYIQDDNDDVIATMSLDIEKQDSGKLRSVCCHPEYRGLGLSGDLLNGIFEVAKEMNLKKITLDTYSNMKRAIAFYHKHGFETIDEAPYGDETKYMLETAV